MTDKQFRFARTSQCYCLGQRENACSKANCTLMTYYGVRDLGPVDPQSHEKHVRNAGRKNRAKADRAKHLLDAEINLIEFEQDVVVYDRSEAQRSDSEGDGSARRTHWRRGHFRRQVCGHARSARKLIFIKPIFVNAHRFQGDVADTEYRLHTAKCASS